VGSARGGFSQATDLAEYVMQTCDLDYRTAYSVVGVAVRTASAGGLRGVDIDGEMLDAAAMQHAGRPLGLSGVDLSQVLDPRHIVETRTAAGGAAPPVVEQMAADCVRTAQGLRVHARSRSAGFETARRVLLDTAAELAADPASKEPAG
jgi:argininosuccinate lyase